MDWHILHNVVVPIQSLISFIGTLIIFAGVLIAVLQFIYYMVKGELARSGKGINVIRLNLGRILILGLEFIVASDLIGTTTAPDYYSVGIVAAVVLIRTVLSFSLSREMSAIEAGKI
jgi:uncharacterized membrane protein